MIQMTDEQLCDQAIDILKTVYDPEIPINIYELGLIYDVSIVEADEGKEVVVSMTLTAPNCPVAESLPMEVEDKLRGLHGISDAKVVITWDPPWEMSKMSEEARLQLGLL
jgi:FeS assembly SUF system protein